ncbi:MAG: benzoate/H(+) symporter BenE family transporter, partial [Rhodospirillales bacterium]|nr:benzoate/H(+) symporter BenE family transporter [Rhodospirillales bacterium]
RQPLVLFWTIPGIVLLGPALEHMSLAEAVGAYYGTGILMIVLGLSGWVRRVMESFPMPIVMAMVAGVFLQFGLGLVTAFDDGPWIAAPMTLTFLLVTALPALSNRLQPLIAALLVGIGAIFVLGAYAPDTELTASLAQPHFITPAFSWAAMVELVVPLAITVLVVQNGQGFAVLDAAGHKPPINSIAVACGVGSLITATVGAVPTCLTGPVNAIISSAGKKEGHYTAGILVGIYAILFGLFAPLFTHLMLATPAAFITTLAGLAMLRVLQGSFVTAFGGRFSLGALVTFLITVSEISIFNIGAPFWGLVIGFVISWILERVDFQSS